MRRNRLWLVALLGLVVLVAWGARWLAQTDAPEPTLREPEPIEALPPVGEPRQPKPIVAMSAADRALVKAARRYFDLDEEAWSRRKQFAVELEKCAKRGVFPLANPAKLTWLVAQSRSFEPSLTDPAWVAENEIEVIDRGRWGHGIRGEASKVKRRASRWAHVRVPDDYVNSPKVLERLPRPGPWPVVIAMHAKRDPEHEHGAGRAWMQSHWGPRVHAALYANWFLLMPIVASAKYAEDGVIRPETIYAILRDFWNRYHMDFDRVVLDGAEDALLFASTNGTNFLAAVVLRDAALKDGRLADPKLAQSIGNMAHIPVYVVGKPAVAKALRAAGLRHVVDGDGEASLVSWMSARRRTMPEKFSWTIVDKDQQVAYWVNVDQPLWDAPTRTIDVEVLADGSNAIELRALGVGELSLFLDDTLVDLDEPVKVRINGTLVHNKKLEPRKKYIGIKRDLKDIFEMPPVDVRKYRYYGWLKPGSIVRIGVPEPRRGAGSANVTPLVARANEKEESDAQKLHGKAEALAETNPAKALKLLKKVLALPPNQFTERARALMQKLGGGEKRR